MTVDKWHSKGDSSDPFFDFFIKSLPYDLFLEGLSWFEMRMKIEN